MTESIIPAAAVAADMGSQSKPKGAADAAKQFEALMIGQMLRSVRESADDDDGDQESQTMLDVADQQFSQVLANNGGLGLSRMIVQGLTKDSTPGEK